MHSLQPFRPVPPVRPISSLRQHQDQILEAMDREPVILSQRGSERAVLVSVEQWNQMIELLETYRGVWRAESLKAQAADDYVEADTLSDALASSGK
jgi:prevent-host-death family protein